MAGKKGGSKGRSFAQYKNLIIDPTEVATKFGYHSTGSPRVDALLNGGLPKGRIIEFYGREQSGKSTLALSAAAQVIKAGGRVLYIDLERGLEVRPQGQGGWLEVNGIDPFGDAFDIVQAGETPLAGEDVYNMMIGSIVDHEHQLIILDSMAAITTRAELAGEIGDSHYGAVAKLNSQALKVMFNHQGTNQETSIIIINQVRDQLQGTMGGLKSTGGRALPHYNHVKLRFDKQGRAEPQKDGDFLTPIRVRIEKARGVPASEVQITVSAHRGIDVLTEIFEIAVEKQYIHQDGAWYTLYNRPVSDAEHDGAKQKADEPGFVHRCQGDTKLKAFIQDNCYDTLYAVATQGANVTLVADENDVEEAA
jgi:recombination protein RecA